MYLYIIMILIDIDYYAVRTALLQIYFRFLKFITKKSLKTDKGSSSSFRVYI